MTRSAERSTASRPFGATTTRCAALLEQRHDQLLIGRIVLGHQDPERLAVRVCATIDGAARRDAADVRRAGPNTVTIASSRSDCLTGLLRYGGKPGLARARPALSRPADVSMINRAPREPRVVLRIARPSAKPSTSGMKASAMHEPRTARRARRPRPAPRARPARRRPNRVSSASWSASLRRMRRLVALSSTTSTRRSVQSRRIAGGTQV